MGQVIFAALDVETTGLDVKRHEVIDFAVVPLVELYKLIVRAVTKHREKLAASSASAAFFPAASALATAASVCARASLTDWSISPIAAVIAAETMLSVSPCV